jgi:hypothetical protein
MSQFRLYSKMHLSKFMSQVAELEIIPNEPGLWKIWNEIEEVPISEKMFYGWMKGLMDNFNGDPFDVNDAKVFSHKRVELFIRRIVSEGSFVTTKDDLRKLWLSFPCQIKRDNLSDYTKFLIEQL